MPHTAEVVITDTMLAPLIETFVLILIMMVGVPYNLAIASSLHRRRSVKNTAWLMLLQHLNYADLLVVGIYVPLQIAKHIATEWLAGDAFCRVMATMNVLCFYAASNMVVCIAMDKVLSFRVQGCSVRMRNARRMLLAGWLMAVVCSAPQLYIYRVERVNTLQQCVDMWYLQRESSLGKKNATSYNDMSVGAAQNVYHWLHLLLVFWLPCLLILCSYGFVCRKIRRFSLQRRHSTIEENMQLNVLSSSETSGAATHQPKTTKVLRISTALVVTYILCWLPYNTVTVVGFFRLTPEIDLCLRVLSQFIVVNSLLNPLLYGVCSGLAMCDVSKDVVRTSTFLERFMQY